MQSDPRSGRYQVHQEDSGAGTSRLARGLEATGAATKGWRSPGPCALRSIDHGATPNSVLRHRARVHRAVPHTPDDVPRCVQCFWTDNAPEKPMAWSKGPRRMRPRRRHTWRRRRSRQRRSVEGLTSLSPIRRCDCAHFPVFPPLPASAPPPSPLTRRHPSACVRCLRVFAEATAQRFPWIRQPLGGTFWGGRLCPCLERVSEARRGSG